MIPAKIMKKYEKIQKNTKTLTFLNMIATTIMNNYNQIPKMIKNDKKLQKH